LFKKPIYDGPDPVLVRAECHSRTDPRVVDMSL